MTDLDWRAALDFAQTLADAARPIALEHFRKPLAIDIKSDASPVTVADRAIEARLRQLIGERFADHAVYGEEMGQAIGETHTWVIDPIDGTKSFISGMPLFGTLIALAERGTPVIGVIDIPGTGERWVGGPEGATLDGSAARVSGCTRLEDARLYATSPDMFAGSEAQAFERVSRRAAFRRFGGDCYVYGLLASGHCDLVVERDLKPFDYMALIPVIEAAGGRITDWRGDALGFASDGRVVAAATPDLHARCLDELGV
ncbi:inositol monophosphatase family protein [Marinivivus vitaminiproducens]|uniref:inositol monophosphatase family protein n=1 Tax=Marinivivus vitaminiproducens TaxID=3035935 RepID=UPI00279DE26D|nr:inositol monophosphatase family protein [Geminicoccaceae bacterium SCSIO 64248]